jgi:chromosome partitioning protein
MILGILSFKGGQAKTTSAIHLAGFFSRLGSSALIDCDPNRSALTWAKSELLPFRVVDELQTARIAREAEHLVVDTKARPIKSDIESLEKNCDLLILPVTPDPLSLEALMLTLDALGTIDKKSYRVLLTICPPFPSHDAEDARRLITGAGLPMFSGQIRRAVAFQRAALAGVLVGDVADPRAEECAADYQAIGRDILKIVKQ